MKKIIISFLAALTMAGCSKKDAVQFCEGVDVEGRGVNCGKKYTTGDLTGVITQDKPFETEMLEVKVFRMEKDIKTPEKTIHLKVERDKKNVSMPLSFYNTGRYIVELYKDKDKLGDCEIDITDVY